MSKINASVGVAAISLLTLLVACTDKEGPGSPADTQGVAVQQTSSPTKPLAAAAKPGRFTITDDVIVLDAASNANRNAYFGDLHVHTAYSFDAFAFGTNATPYDAYRYAQGEAIKHPGGFDMQLRKPLDFYAVTDHAGFLGIGPEGADTTTEFSQYKEFTALNNLNDDGNRNEDSIPARRSIFRTFLPVLFKGIADGSVSADKLDTIARDAWADTIKAAEQFNKPGEFTTFVAYEYTTSSADRGNLHRNVIFRGSDKLPAAPFSILHSKNPENLWDWMDGLRDQGIESLAIPHNSNGSNGQMFKLVDWAGNPMDDNYTKQRLRNEPLIEITQIKGTSETHPILSDNDEWAGFEIASTRVATNLPSEPKGSYAREALLTGIAFADQGIANPYKFGFIGSSDTHTGATSDDEAHYFSKIGLLDSTAQLRGSVPLTGAVIVETKNIDGANYAPGYYQQWGASGLAGVWAEQNTRAAIYDALRRKETFATSGPRIKVRFFAGFEFDKAMLETQNMVTRAYAEGVSMGSDLVAQASGAPSFIIWAVQDTSSAPLQRLQIIKGWTAAGINHEKVYDVACSDGGTIDPATQRCSDNGAKVNIANCSLSSDTGAAELKSVWSDPDFDPTIRAFYYARVLENPSCRWSTWDALRAGVAVRSDIPPTVQERAWSSPIWITPNR